MVYRQERILRERFAQVTCAACGRCHRPDDMLVLAQRASRWLLLLTCWQCQRRSIFVASFPQPHSTPEGFSSLDALSALDTPQSDDIPGLVHSLPTDSLDSPDPLNPFDSPPDSAITSEDVEGMRHFLEGFNGDFGALFGPPEGRSRG